MRRIAALLAAIAVLTASCGTVQTASGGETSTSTPPGDAGGTTTVAGAPESTVAAPATTMPGTSSDGGGAALHVGEAPLVYMSLGPSGNFFPGPTTGMIFLYADMLEERFGVEVDHRNHTIGGDDAEALLERMRTNDRLRQDLAEAHVVTLMFPIDYWVSPMQTAGGYQGKDPALCGGDDNQQCLRDALATHRQSVDAILEELTLRCPPTEVLIRIADTYMIHTRDKISAGTLDFIIPYWRDAQEYIEEAAAGHGIPVAHVFDALMGPDGLDDPQEKGLMLDDQEHPNEAGARLMADLVDALGYDLAG